MSIPREHQFIAPTARMAARRELDRKRKWLGRESTRVAAGVSAEWQSRHRVLEFWLKRKPGRAIGSGHFERWWRNVRIAQTDCLCHRIQRAEHSHRQFLTIRSE